MSWRVPLADIRRIINVLRPLVAIPPTSLTPAHRIGIPSRTDRTRRTTQRVYRHLLSPQIASQFIIPCAWGG